MQMNLLEPLSRSDLQPAGGAEAGEDGAAQRPKRERLQSLDALRGLNVIVMMFVDDTWIDSLDHAAWDGSYHLADFVMPTFLLMVGASMSFSMKKYGGPGLKWKVLDIFRHLLPHAGRQPARQPGHRPAQHAHHGHPAEDRLCLLHRRADEDVLARAHAGGELPPAVRGPVGGRARGQARDLQALRAAL